MVPGPETCMRKASGRRSGFVIKAEFKNKVALASLREDYRLTESLGSSRR
jgi:hypothetical protein